MSTISIILLSLFGFLLLMVLIKMIFFPYWIEPVNEFETTTTTTTTTTTEDPPQPTYKVVGQLQRSWEGSQPYVIDPHDGDKMWLNTNDDMYEDGAGRIWRLK